jgi:hypothetical protein
MNELAILKSISESEVVIKSNENFVGMGLWNIGNELKYIRDNKTYTEKSCSSFEEYVEKELDYSKRNAYRYIEISEGYNVTSMAQIGHLGMVKLLALSKIEEPQREEFLENNSVNEMTTKELQQAIKDRDKAINEKDIYSSAMKKAEGLQFVSENLLRESKENAKEDIRKLKDLLKSEKEKSSEEIAKLQTFIGEAKASGNNEEVERLQASLKEAQGDLDSSALRIDELEEQAKKPIDVITAEPVIIEKIPDAIAIELEELRNKSGQNTTQPVLKFKIYFEELQNVFRHELEVMDEIKKDYPEMHGKCKNAISRLINEMSERL